MTLPTLSVPRSPRASSLILSSRRPSDDGPPGQGRRVPHRQASDDAPSQCRTSLILATEQRGRTTAPPD
uniref:Uncharacterized protein n=1 Tax=Oryza rufipogon TaxID=4529 RepID=A0A0E0NRZ2_ORYRU